MFDSDLTEQKETNPQSPEEYVVDYQISRDFAVPFISGMSSGPPRP